MVKARRIHRPSLLLPPSRHGLLLRLSSSRAAVARCVILVKLAGEVGNAEQYWSVLRGPGGGPDVEPVLQKLEYLIIHSRI